MSTQRKPIGVILKERGLIGEEHIQFALQEQQVTKERLGEILESLGVVSQYDVATVLAEQEGIEYINLDEVVPDEAALRLFNKNLCLNNGFLPMRREGNTLLVATAQVDLARLTQVISRHGGLAPRLAICEQAKLNDAIHNFYYFLENPVEELIQREIRVLSADHDMVRSTDNLIDLVLQLAVKHRASDIHIRPMERSLNLAFRVDGVMRSVLSMPVEMKRLIASLKMRANMDISEMRLPQDGAFRSAVLRKDYYFRVSTTVTPYGENMVLRVLPMGAGFLGMAQIGFLDEDVEQMKRLFNEPYGIVLLTGPTGSGKTTTLYATLQALDLLKKNVVTVENPIEYRIPLLRQTEVNERAGYGFATAVRYFLRHDPDVILVGEIRDEETAETALSASVTGHLVLSTLHTNSALGAIPRLRALGMPPFTLADSLKGIVSQRLVRRICTHCKESYAPDRDELALLGEEVALLYRGKGCEVCDGSGYLGRTLIYEILAVDQELAFLISEDADLKRFSKAAVAAGFRDIHSVAREKVKQGITTLAEMRRVLGG